MGFRSCFCVLRVATRLEETGLNPQGTSLFRADISNSPRPALVIDFLEPATERRSRRWGEVSAKIHQLRPVTFRLKTELQGAIQYGLIAEEVSKVYPDLVIRDEHGGIQGVRYDELAPLLLNEVQRQRRILDTQAEKLQEIQRQLAEFIARNAHNEESFH